jgi:hypothetical protein
LTRRRKKRNPKTVITPKERPLFPSQLSSRSALCGLLVLGLALSLGSARPAAEPFSHPPEKPYALVFCTVWGPDDRPLYGVKVKVRRATEKKARWELYSDHNGEAAFRVPAGQVAYILWADLKGYKFEKGQELRGDEVKVQVTFDERIDVGLHLKH